MHMVVLGWFGASVVWFLPLLWRLFKLALPGSAGVRGPGTIRLWLGFVAVLLSSSTLYYFLTDNAFHAPGHLQTARIYDSLGETDNAIRDYEHFVSMWKECDPEQRPEVDRARARLAQLRAGH